MQSGDSNNTCCVNRRGEGGLEGGKKKAQEKNRTGGAASWRRLRCATPGQHEVFSLLDSRGLAGPSSGACQGRCKESFAHCITVD